MANTGYNFIARARESAARVPFAHFLVFVPFPTRTRSFSLRCVRIRTLNLAAHAMTHNEQFRVKTGRRNETATKIPTKFEERLSAFVFTMWNSTNSRFGFICAYCEPWRGDNIILWAQCCSCNIRIRCYMCARCSPLARLSTVRPLCSDESKLFELLWYMHHVFLLYSLTLWRSDATRESEERASSAEEKNRFPETIFDQIKAPRADRERETRASAASRNVASVITKCIFAKDRPAPAIAGDDLCHRRSIGIGTRRVRRSGCPGPARRLHFKLWTLWL